MCVCMCVQRNGEAFSPGHPEEGRNTGSWGGKLLGFGTQPQGPGQLCLTGKVTPQTGGTWALSEHGHRIHEAQTGDA